MAEIKESKLIFAELQSYPLPSEVIRNGTFIPYQRTNTTFDDLIRLNLEEIIPNIPLGLHYGHSNEDIVDWIKKTKEYSNKINEEYNRLCDKKLKQMEFIKKQDELRNKFDVNRVKELPSEVELRVFRFLDPETRLTHLEENNKDVKDKMKKWKVSDFKTFYRDVVVPKELKKTHDYSSKAGIERLEYHLTINNKKEYMNEIFKVLYALKNAIPKDYDKYHKYKKLANRLFCSILYLNKKLST